MFRGGGVRDSLMTVVMARQPGPCDLMLTLYIHEYSSVYNRLLLAGRQFYTTNGSQVFGN